MKLTERGFESGRATAGVNKGRKVWHGIGLRLNTNPPDGGDDGSPGERCRENGSPRESGEDTPHSQGSSGVGEPSEPKNQEVPKENPRVEENAEKRFTSFTEAQQREVRKLVRDGMSKEWARRTVLANEHPLDCECEVCL